MTRTVLTPMLARVLAIAHAPLILAIAALAIALAKATPATMAVLVVVTTIGILAMPSSGQTRYRL